MRFNIGFIQMQSWDDDCPYSKKGFWIRLFGYGIHVTNSFPTFSVRNGYVKFIRLPFGYRLKFLKR